MDQETYTLLDALLTRQSEARVATENFALALDSLQWRLLWMPLVSAAVSAVVVGATAILTVFFTHRFTSHRETETAHRLAQQAKKALLREKLEQALALLTGIKVWAELVVLNADYYLKRNADSLKVDLEEVKSFRHELGLGALKDYEMALSLLRIYSDVDDESLDKLGNRYTEFRNICARDLKIGFQGESTVRGLPKSSFDAFHNLSAACNNLVTRVREHIRLEAV